MTRLLPFQVHVIFGKLHFLRYALLRRRTITHAVLLLCTYVCLETGANYVPSNQEVSWGSHLLNESVQAKKSPASRNVCHVRTKACGGWSLGAVSAVGWGDHSVFFIESLLDNLPRMWTHTAISRDMPPKVFPVLYVSDKKEFKPFFQKALP